MSAPLDTGLHGSASPDLEWLLRAADRACAEQDVGSYSEPGEWAKMMARWLTDRGVVVLEYAQHLEPPYLAIAKALSGLSDEALAHIACWGAVQPCGHPRAEHEVAVQVLMESGYSGAVDGVRAVPAPQEGPVVDG